MNNSVEDVFQEQKRQLRYLLQYNASNAEIKYLITKIIYKARYNGFQASLEASAASATLAPLLQAFSEVPEAYEATLATLSAWTLCALLKEPRALPWAARLTDRLAAALRATGRPGRLSALLAATSAASQEVGAALSISLGLHTNPHYVTTPISIPTSTPSPLLKHALNMYNVERGVAPRAEEWGGGFFAELLKYGYSATSSAEIVVKLLETTKTSVNADFLAKLVAFVNATYRCPHLYGADPAEVARAVGIGNSGNSGVYGSSGSSGASQNSLGTPQGGQGVSHSYYSATYASPNPSRGTGGTYSTGQGSTYGSYNGFSGPSPSPFSAPAPDKWAMNALFKGVFRYTGAAASTFSPKEVIFRLKLPETADPGTLLTSIISLLYAFHAPYCLCSDCGAKYSFFPLLQLLVDLNNEICPVVRVLLIKAVIWSTYTINSNLHRFYYHLRGSYGIQTVQGNYSHYNSFSGTYRPNIDPRATDYFLLSSYYAYYISFSKLTPYDSNAIDEYGYMFDYIAYTLHKYGIRTVRTCQKSGCAVSGASNRPLAPPDAYIESHFLGLHYVWRCVDFVRALVRLRGRFYREVDEILCSGWASADGQRGFAPAAERGGDYLCYSLVYVFLRPKVGEHSSEALKAFKSAPEASEATETPEIDEITEMRRYIKCVACLCIYKHFNKYGRTKSNQPVLEAVAKVPEIIEFTLECIYKSYPGLCGKLLDTAYEYRCLYLCIKYPCNIYFGLDMATLAAGRYLINLSLYLNGQFLYLGLPFAEAVCVYVIKKLVKFRKAITPEFAETAFKYTKVVGDEYEDCGALPITLAENEALVKNSIKNATFPQEFQSLHLSNAVISESLVGCFFRLLTYYYKYFRLIAALPTLRAAPRLFKRVDYLFSLATELCLGTFPRIPQILASELLYISDSVKDGTYELLCDFFLDGRYNRSAFLYEIDALFKGYELDKRFYYICAINQLVSGVARPEGFVSYFNCREAEYDAERIVLLLFEVSGTLLGYGLVYDVFQPRLLTALLARLRRRAGPRLIKAFLEAFAEASKAYNYREEFRGLNFSQDWHSFYGILGMFIDEYYGTESGADKGTCESYDAPGGTGGSQSASGGSYGTSGSLSGAFGSASVYNLPQLSPSALSYFYTYSYGSARILRTSLAAVQCADEAQRSRDLFEVLAVPRRLIQAICFDVDIVEAAKRTGSPMRFRPVAAQLGYHQQLEQIRERLLALAAADPYTVTAAAAELRAAREPALVCQYFALHAFLEPERDQILGAALVHCPELVQNSIKYCISAVLRLAYLPKHCTTCFRYKHARDRREAIEIYGKFLGIYCTYRTNLTILSYKVLDFNFLIQYAAECGTLDVVSVFICYFLYALSSQASVMPASNGFTLVILKKLEEAVEKQFFAPHYRLIDDVDNKDSYYSNSSYSDENSAEEDEYLLEELRERQYLAKQDIEHCRSAMFNNYYDPAVIRGNLLKDSEWFNCLEDPIQNYYFNLVIPQLFRSKYTLQVLYKSSHVCMVPLNLTMCFVYENAELLTQLRIVQMQYKYNNQLEVIMKRINDLLYTTVHTTLYHMIPEFNGTVQYSVWKSHYYSIYREVSSVIGCRLLRIHLLRPLAEYIYDAISKKFSFTTDADQNIVAEINKKIIMYLSYMASEYLIINLQQQINGTIYMRKNALNTKYEFTNENDQTPINDPSSMLTTPEYYITKYVSHGLGQDKLTYEYQELIDKITQLYADSNTQIHMKYIKFDYNLLIYQVYYENSDGLCYTALPMHLFDSSYEGIDGILTYYITPGDRELLDKMRNGKFPFTLSTYYLLLINKINNAIIIHNTIDYANTPYKMLYKLIKKIIITQQQYQDNVVSVQMLYSSDPFRVLLNDTLYYLLQQYYQADKQYTVYLLRYLSIYLLSSCNININIQIYQNDDPISDDYLGDEILGKHHAISNKIKLTLYSYVGKIQVSFKESSDQLINELFEQDQDQIYQKVYEYFKNKLIENCFSNNVQGLNDLKLMLTYDENMYIVQNVMLCSNPYFNMSVIFEIIFTIIRFIVELQSSYYSNNYLSVITTQINKYLKYIWYNLLTSCLICDLCDSYVQFLSSKIEDRSVFYLYQSYLENIIFLKQRIDLMALDNSLYPQYQKIYDGLQLYSILDTETEMKNVVSKLFSTVSNSKLYNVNSQFVKYIHNFPYTLTAVASAMRNIVYCAQWCWDQPVSLDMLARSNAVINSEQHYEAVKYTTNGLKKEVYSVFYLCTEFYIFSHEEYRSYVPSSIVSFLYLHYIVEKIYNTKCENVDSHYTWFQQLSKYLLEDGASAVDRNVTLSFLFYGNAYINVRDPKASVENVLSAVDCVLFSVLKQHIQFNVENNFEQIQPSADLLVKYLYICLLLYHEYVHRIADSGPIYSLKVILLKCIAYRIVQQCNVYSCSYIAIIDKYEVLCKCYNYDLSGYPLSARKETGKAEYYENYVRAAVWLAYHVLGRLLSLVLGGSVALRRSGAGGPLLVSGPAPRAAPAAAILGALRQLRPQTAPHCAALLAAALAEPQLLKALRPAFLPGEVAESAYSAENVVSAYNPVFGYKSPLWDAYAKGLRSLLAYVDYIAAYAVYGSQHGSGSAYSASYSASHAFSALNVAGSSSGYGAAALVESAHKLLLLVRYCSDFTRHYRVYLAAALTGSGSYRLRAAVLSDPGAPADAVPTDEVSGLLSLPLTDRREWLYCPTLLAPAGDLPPWGAAWLRAYLLPCRGLQLADRAGAIVLGFFEVLRKQQRRGSVEEQQAFRDLAQGVGGAGEAGLALVYALGAVPGRPSEETLLASLLLRAISEGGSTTAREAARLVSRERDLRFLRRVAKASRHK